MRSRTSSALALAAVCVTGSGFAQTAPEAPPPPPTVTAPAPAPMPPPATDAPQAPPAPKRHTLTSVGIGPTYFGALGSSGSELHRPGVMLAFGSRVPIGDNAGFDIRLNWGLTEFYRFEDFTRAGYRTGRWTTQAYEDVWSWAGQKDDWEVFRWMGAAFAFVGLVFPYIAAGVCYAAAPFAPTTYLGLDLAGSYEFGDDKARPYLKAGLGLVGYVHPRNAELMGGVGPMMGVGIRVDTLDVSAQMTWLPPSLHGELDGQRTNVLVGGLTLGVSN